MSYVKQDIILRDIFNEIFGEITEIPKVLQDLVREYYLAPEEWDSILNKLGVQLKTLKHTQRSVRPVCMSEFKALGKQIRTIREKKRGLEDAFITWCTRLPPKDGQIPTITYVTPYEWFMSKLRELPTIHLGLEGPLNSSSIRLQFTKIEDGSRRCKIYYTWHLRKNAKVQPETLLSFFQYYFFKDLDMRYYLEERLLDDEMTRRLHIFIYIPYTYHSSPESNAVSGSGFRFNFISGLCFGLCLYVCFLLLFV